MNRLKRPFFLWIIIAHAQRVLGEVRSTIPAFIASEVRDCLGDMATQVWSQEPIVKEADSKADGLGLRDDLGIRGVWTPRPGGSVFLYKNH